MERDFNVYAFYKQIQVNSIILSFKGAVSQDLLSRLAANLKNKSLADNTAIGRKVFGIFIELAQNVHLHSSEKSYSVKEDRPIGTGFLLVGEASDHYLISSSNMIKVEETVATLERCKYINSLNEEGLKKYYKEQRRMPQRKDKPGANIGLIDMARRSSNPIDASVYAYDDENSIITLSIKLDKTLKKQ